MVARSGTDLAAPLGLLLVACSAFPLPEPREPVLDLHRTVVLGASLSSGFCSQPLATKMRELAPEGGEVLDASELLFFEDPVGRGHAAVDRAVAFDPTFVVALDYLFWFAYFHNDVSMGLAELDRVRAPMVVGDIPWMGRAAKWILPAPPPPKDILDGLNARIRAWAEARGDVTVVPLSAWVDALYLGVVPAETWRIGIQPESLLFLDGLHPTDDGADFVLARALNLAASHVPRR